MPFCMAGWFSGGSYMYQVLSKLSGLELWPVGGGGRNLSYLIAFTTGLNNRQACTTVQAYRVCQKFQSTLKHYVSHNFWSKLKVNIRPIVTVYLLDSQVA